MRRKKQQESYNHQNHLFYGRIPSNEDEFTDLLSVICDQLLVKKNLTKELSLALIDMGFVIAFENEEVSDLEVVKSRAEENMRIIKSMISYRQ